MEQTRQIDVRGPARSAVVSGAYPAAVSGAYPAAVSGAYPVGAAIDQLQTTTHDPFQERRQIAIKVVQAIHLLFGSIGALIAIRVVLRLLGANQGARFAEWITGITSWPIAPFAGLFSEPVVAGNVLEVNALVALVVYGLLAWMLGKLAWLALGETRTGLITHGRHLRADNLTP